MGVNANLQGNQFVWVPVDQNQVLTLNITSTEDIAEIILTYPEETQTKLSANGKTFHQEIPMTQNGIYSVSVTTTNSSKTIHKRITSLYAQDVEAHFTRVLWKKQNQPDYNSLKELIEDKLGAGKTEEDFLTWIQEQGYTSLSQYLGEEYIYVVGHEKEFEEGYKQQYAAKMLDHNQNLESVNRYGGFYIARYEAGDGTNNAPRTEFTEDTHLLISKKYIIMWE